MTAKIKNRASSGHKHKPKNVSSHAFEKVYWPYIPVVIVVGILLTFSAQTGALQAALSSHSSKVLAYSTSMSVGGLLSDTNTSRAANGVAALTLNAQLDAAAQASANDMASRNYWSHNTPEGNPPWIWVTAQGYAYQKLGQNLAAGFGDEQATINGWMASPPHRENLLDPAFQDVGFGFANNADYTSAGGGPMTIVVAFYGQPQGAAAAAPTVPAAPTTPAPTPTSGSPSQAASSPPSQPAASGSSAPTGSSPPSSSPATPANQLEQPTAKAAAPATTDTDTGGITLAYKTSRAQLASANLPVSSFATGLVLFGLFATAGLWVSRHMLGMRRAFAYSEKYVVSHPLMDVGMLTIASLFYLLSQTVGLIK